MALQSLFLCFGHSQTSCLSELWPTSRCMALLLYHGSAVGVHMLAACLLWRQTAAYRHERIKCLTLVIAFVIMMVRRGAAKARGALFGLEAGKFGWSWQASRFCHMWPSRTHHYDIVDMRGRHDDPEANPLPGCDPQAVGWAGGVLADARQGADGLARRAVHACAGDSHLPCSDGALLAPPPSVCSPALQRAPPVLLVVLHIPACSLQSSCSYVCWPGPTACKCLHACVCACGSAPRPLVAHCAGCHAHHWVAMWDMMLAQARSTLHGGLRACRWVPVLVQVVEASKRSPTLPCVMGSGQRSQP